MAAQLESSETVEYLASQERRLAAKDEVIAGQARELVALRSAKEALARAAVKANPLKAAQAAQAAAAQASRAQALPVETGAGFTGRVVVRPESAHRAQSRRAQAY